MPCYWGQYLLLAYIVLVNLETFLTMSCSALGVIGFTGILPVITDCKNSISPPVLDSSYASANSNSLIAVATPLCFIPLLIWKLLPATSLAF
jgi:hypothetical protein